MAIDCEHELIEDLIRLLQHLQHHRKDITMSQVQLSVTFNVAPASAPPLTLTPASATENLTVGTPSDGTLVSAVTGGVPPYTYASDPASGPLPTGVSFVEDGSGNISLAGTPTVAGSSTTPVLLNVTDSAGTTAQLKAAVRTIR
jgi:hypothetical protein